MKNMKLAVLMCAVMSLLHFGPVWAQDDETTLTDMLQEFLANSGKEAAHDKFWADDLVYSSSAGLRFGKAEIMQGFSGADDSSVEPPPIAYRGEDVDVRLYGDMAVVAFKLVGVPADGSRTLFYYNTGTFLKRDGVWKVVAWQATQIPPTGSGGD
jgi:hypothetical protein